MKRTLGLALMICLLGAWPVWAQTADEILKKMDDQATSFTDLSIKMTMTTKSADGPEKANKVETYQKGSKRLYRFVDSGMAFLSLDSDTSYVYMPEEKKVRRIAAHAQNQTFMGTDYNSSDMSVTRYDDIYTPKLVETTAAWVLDLTPKSNKTSAYSKIRMTIDKANNYITRMDYYNKKGEMEKTELRKEYRQFNGFWYTMLIEITNVKNNHKTFAKGEEVKFNAGLDDELFTQRYLKRLEQ